MKKHLTILIVCICFLGSLHKIAMAKTKSLSSKKGRYTTLLSHFDINTTKLPSHYKGTDIERLYSIFAKKAPLNKAEFETTAEYEKKIAEAINGNIYAFKIEPDLGPHGLTISPYDADRQEFLISLETVYLSDNEFEDYRASLIIKSLNKGSLSYAGENALGAIRDVTHFNSTQYGLALVNERDFGSNGSDDDKYHIKSVLRSIRRLSIAIQIPPDRARKLKGNIGVLLLCRPALYRSDDPLGLIKSNGLILEKDDFVQATFDNPVSHDYKRKYINVEILAIWIYNTRTGEIISKKALDVKR